MGFASGCYGMKTDVSIGGGVVFGVWKSLDSVPGKSFVGLLKWSRGNAVAHLWDVVKSFKSDLMFLWTALPV